MSLKNWRVYDVMPRAFFSDSFNDIDEIQCGQAEEKLEAGGDEKLIFGLNANLDLKLGIDCLYSLSVHAQ